MEFYDVINTRRTVREFMDTPVKIETIKRIVHAGLQAPTHNHLRDWEFIAVTDKNRKEELLREVPRFTDEQAQTFVQKRGLNNARAEAMYLKSLPRQYSMLHTSGCLILPLIKLESPLLEPKTLSSLNAFASIWCTIENMLLAATYEGLSTAIRIPFEKEQQHIQKVIGHPDGYLFPCYVAIGYPAPDTYRAEQNLYGPETKLHLETW